MNKAFENKLMVTKNRLYICYATRLELLDLLFKRDQKELILTFKCKVNCYCFRLNVINQC